VSAAVDAQVVSEGLLAYIGSRVGREVSLASPLAPLEGGFETSSFRFQLTDACGDLGDLTGPQVLRLYPAFYGPHNAVWESSIQNVLAAAGFPVARARLLCTEMSVLGGAFYVMDCLPGRPLAAAPRDLVPELLGTMHAQLHEIAPGPVIGALERAGVDMGRCWMASRYDWLASQAVAFPWVRPAVDWLAEHRPTEPASLSICHGDFHPFNLLYADGRITGVLDWPGFSLADPTYDVGNTLVILTIAAKHLTGSMDAFASVDWDLMAELYLAAYKTCRPLDRANLDYYRVRRCVAALVEGAEGRGAWHHPPVIRDLLAVIQDVTGVRVDVPS